MALASRFAPGELGSLAGSADHETFAGWLRDLTEPAFLIRRWRLVIFSFPIVLLFVGIRWAQWTDGIFESPLDLTIVAPVTTAVVFVCAKGMNVTLWATKGKDSCFTGNWVGNNGRDASLLMRT